MFLYKMILICVIFGVLCVTVNGEYRIAGGNVSTISEFPFAAALLTNGGQGSFRHACGATILTTNALLSAASCFYTGQTAHPVTWWRARVGSTYSNGGGTIYIIRNISPHPNFSPTTLANDIAVLRTTLTIQLVPGLVETARIAGAAYTFTQNQVVTAIGWGATSGSESSSSEELRSANVYVSEQLLCATRYAEVGFTVTDNMVCAGWLDVIAVGQCQGDEGGSLLDNRSVVGVTSRTEGCDEYYPPVSTRLAPYISWVVATALAT